MVANQFSPPSCTLYCSCLESYTNAMHGGQHFKLKLVFVTYAQRWFDAFGIGEKRGGTLCYGPNLYDLSNILCILGTMTIHGVGCKHSHLLFFNTDEREIAMGTLSQPLLVFLKYVDIPSTLAGVTSANLSHRKCEWSTPNTLDLQPPTGFFT